MTWLSCPGGHDLEMMSRPGLGLGKGRRSRHAPMTWALCARPAHVECATCAGPACYTRSSAHDMGTARPVCARPGFWVCALYTQPSFVTVHYLDTIQRKKKKSTKIFKIFLGVI